MHVAWIKPEAIRSRGTSAHSPIAMASSSSSSSSSSFSVQRSVFRRIDALLGEFRVGGGVHDSYTFQCGLVGSFISPGIDTR